MTKVFCVIVSFCLCVSFFAEELPIAKEPNDEETLTLEYINRFRANPAKDIDLQLRGAHAGFYGMKPTLNIEKCRSDVASLKPVPPLVFNMQLLTAARWHANFLIKNGSITQHHENEGLSGFSGVNPAARIRLAKYGGMGMMENAFGHSISVWNSHRGYIIDWGDGPDGMQNPPGHRLALASPYVREIGCAVIRHKNSKGSGELIASVHNFGNNRKVIRSVGGVFYDDKNKNEFYDVGEGLGGASIIAETGEKCVSWKSGAYTLVLKHADATSIKFKLGDKEWVKAIPKGLVNIHLSFDKPGKKDSAFVDLEIKKVEVAKEKYKEKAAIQCWFDTRGYSRSLEQDKKIEVLCGKFVLELEKQKEVVRKELYEGNKLEFNKVIGRPKVKYKITRAGRWFSDAATAFKAYYEAKKLLRGLSINSRKYSKVKRSVKSCYKKVRTLEFKNLMNDLDLLFSYAFK